MRRKGRKILAVVTGLALLAGAAGRVGLLDTYPRTVYAQERSALVNATNLNVRSGPGTGNQIVARLAYGASVTVTGETTASDGVKWYKLRFVSGSQTLTGYASSEYIKFPVTYSTDAAFENHLNQQGFPESYKDALRQIHAEHPSWVFTAQHTGLDWNDVIANEGTVGANLVGTNSISSWKSTEYGAYDWNTGKWTGFDGPTWVAASREIVAYYMDPRNFLNDTYVFQFLNHNYNSNIQTKEGLLSLVKGTFLEGGNVADQTGQQTGTNSQDTPGNPNGPGNGTNQGNSNDPGYGTGQGNPNGPGSGMGQGNTNGPGSGTGQGNTGGPGYGSGNGQSGINVGPGGGPGHRVALPSEAPGQPIREGLSGPASAASIWDVRAAAVNTEYGPGMDMSSVTNDPTGQGETAPVPSGSGYVDVIMNAAAQSGVNPYVLGAMILQEQGKGTSGSISGTAAGYEGYYNFFNIGAYATGNMSAVTRGLWYASQPGSYGRPWDSIEKSIVGGAIYYGENFVKAGQDTFYLKKFNVQGSNLYKHQYMTNVEGAAGEGAKLSRAYTDQMKKQALTFKIPVFNNMPETACARPALDGSPNNKLASLEVTGYSLTPTFSQDRESYDLIVNPSTDRIAVNAVAADSKASVNGAGTVTLQSGNNTVSIEVRAENGTVRTYRLNVVRQGSAPVVTVPDTGNDNNGNGQNMNQTGSQTGPGSLNQGSGQTPAVGDTYGPGMGNGSDSSGGTGPASGPGGPA
ncbi:MAG: SH3 domain-containing protein [Lachnospiraceae bacterium]|nr:SH3 domain-containing protein [Lachnospiraceae bacterium]